MVDAWQETTEEMDGVFRRYCRQRIPAADLEDVVQDIWVRVESARDRHRRQSARLCHGYCPLCRRCAGLRELAQRYGIPEGTVKIPGRVFRSGAPIGGA